MRCIIVLLGALLAWAPARADSVLDRVLGAAGLDGDATDLFLGAAADAALQALFERVRVVNPKVESPFGVSLVTPGSTAELRCDEGTFNQARRVEQAFQRVLKLNPDQAMQYALEDRALRQLVEAGLKSALAKAGVLEVLTSDELRQWTAQRRSERQNDEVRQGSLPARRTLERPFLVIRWRWVPIAGLDYERWWQVVTMRNIVELTSQLSVSVQLADSGITVGTFVVPVEVRAVGAGPGQRVATYGRPFLHVMMSKATEALGVMLAQEAGKWDQVALGRLRLQVAPTFVPDETLRPGQPMFELPKLVPAQGLPRYRVFAVYQRWAVLTAGQEEGLVGTNDADGNPAGSLVTIGGYSFKLTRTARRLSLISFEGLPLQAQEALSVPDAAVSWSGMPAALPMTPVPPVATTPGGFIPD